MSQPAKMQEPTMEEILASIRRIIAEDDLRPAPPPPPPPPPATPGLAEAAPIPAAAEGAARDEVVDGFDDPEVSNVAANDVFEQRESPWRPGEFAGVELAGVDGTAEETRESAAPDIHRDAPMPAAPLDLLRFAAAQPEPAPPEPARDLPSREPSRPPRFEAPRSDVAKAELAKLELARSEFLRAEAAKSEFTRPDHAKPDIAKPELPKFEMPRREAPQRESRPEPARPPTPPVLRGADQEGLLSPRTTAAVDLAFNTLAQTVLVQNSRTLEELVREMLKPMLKAWLDDNLPSLVERLVRAEIERVSRGRS
jgi:cell pole-organizing protein PopZ